MARRRLDPFETEITHLGAKGLGMGMAPDGVEVKVRGAVPGSRVAVTPAGKRKGVWNGRKTAMIRPPADGVEPRCAVFGLCGGCMLQEGSLASQRHHKGLQAIREIEDGAGSIEGVKFHDVRGAPGAYGYRNRIEMSFGPRRWLTEEAQQGGATQFGAFLGMHPPGRFDRIVDSPRCELVSEPMNALLAHVRAVALAEGAPACRDVHTHEGFWRHVRLREGHHTGERLIILFTTSPKADEERWIEAIAARVTDEAVGVVWCVDDGIADVARGEVRRVFGSDHLTEELRPVGLRSSSFQLSATSFFQTNTLGAEVLYATVAEAIGHGERLLDLYCGTGSIGIALADQFREVVGIEEVEAAVVDARANALANGVEATYRCAKVEDALDALGADAHIIVDPPRAGLHPKVAKHLANVDAKALVYVACKAGSLGRDAAFLAAGGWKLVEVWIIDLFPQTGHIELVGRFERG